MRKVLEKPPEKTMRREEFKRYFRRDRPLTLKEMREKRKSGPLVEEKGEEKPSFLRTIRYAYRRERAYQRILDESLDFETAFWRLVNEHNKERCWNRWAKRNIPAAGIALGLLYYTWTALRTGAMEVARLIGHPTSGFIFGQVGSGAAEVAVKDTPVIDWMKERPDMRVPDERYDEASVKLLAAVGGAWGLGYLFEHVQGMSEAIPGIFGWDGLERTASGLGLTIMVNAWGNHNDVIDTYKYWRAMAELLVMYGKARAMDVVDEEGVVKAAVVREILRRR